jgi:hypothetical protein
MFKFLKSLFSKEAKVTPGEVIFEGDVVVQKKSRFTIEHYPLTNRYYPKDGNHFIYRSPISGCFERSATMALSEYSKTIEGADRILKEYRELVHKNNINIINR